MRVENFMYVKANPECNRGPAISFYWKYDKENKQVVFTAAFCSKQDIFSKKIARAICRGRFEKGYVDRFYLPSSNPNFDYPKNRDVIDKLVELYNEGSISWEKIIPGGRIPDYFPSKI